jgi:hypothetical protein
MLAQAGHVHARIPFMSLYGAVPQLDVPSAESGAVMTALGQFWTADYNLQVSQCQAEVHMA